ncbi:MAG TPA: integrase arm-type DNA-binding domain-containing protein [Croceibacterium sp.]|nr:integrase arm-type DNA-binding domain-containing protein [Croceibacterium sp.]
MGKLTQAHIRAALAKPGRHHDGDGLVLFVRESGQASWVARVQQDGARREFGLGSLRAVGLADAREKAALVKAAMVAGRDPHFALKPPKEMTRTFREAALGFLDAKTADAKISNGKRKQNLSQLKTYAFPALGKLQVQSIDADAIAACLRPIWTRKPETARKVRSLIIRTLRFARPDGALFIGTLGPAVADRLPAQPKRGNFEAMPYADLPAFMTRLVQKGGMGALALRAAILTATRSGEVRGATWSELDLDAAVWTIPADRMKAQRVHRVPLSPVAVALFREVAAMKRGGTDLIFPANGGKALSDMTLTKVLRDMKAACTVHGFRSTFRDWAAEQTSVPGEVAEAALAHMVPKAVEAAYRRTDFFDKRRELMEAWASYVGGHGGAEVVPLAVASSTRLRWR